MSARNSDAPDSGSTPPAGVDRRGLMKGAAQIGAAGLAAGVVLKSTTASAAEPAAAPAAATASEHDSAFSGAHEPLVVHVIDASTGELDLYQGEEHRRVTDRKLAAALLRHTR